MDFKNNYLDALSDRTIRIYVMMMMFGLWVELTYLLQTKLPASSIDLFISFTFNLIKI